MPGPVGLPFDTVTPEVSEGRGMPCNRRPASRATNAGPASCTIVTTFRANRHGLPTTTTASATRPVTPAMVPAASTSSSKARSRSRSKARNTMAFSSIPFTTSAHHNRRGGLTPPPRSRKARGTLLFVGYRFPEEERAPSAIRSPPFGHHPHVVDAVASPQRGGESGFRRGEQIRMSCSSADDEFGRERAEPRQSPHRLHSRKDGKRPQPVGVELSRQRCVGYRAQTASFPFRDTVRGIQDAELLRHGKTGYLTATHVEHSAPVHGDPPDDGVGLGHPEPMTDDGPTRRFIRRTEQYG